MAQSRAAGPFAIEPLASRELWEKGSRVLRAAADARVIPFRFEFEGLQVRREE